MSNFLFNLHHLKFCFEFLAEVIISLKWPHFALCTLQTAVPGGGSMQYSGRRKREGGQGPVRYHKGVPEGNAPRKPAWTGSLQEGKLKCTPFSYCKNIEHHVFQTLCGKWCKGNYL